MRWCGSALRYRCPFGAFPPKTWAACCRKWPFFLFRGLKPTACNSAVFASAYAQLSSCHRMQVLSRELPASLCLRLMPHDCAGPAVALTRLFGI